MAFLNGLVGHHGRYGCQLYCPLAGRRKEGSEHYYAAAQKPEGYELPKSNHADVKLDSLSTQSSAETAARYNANLKTLVQNTNSTASYERIHLETGIAKPSTVSW